MSEYRIDLMTPAAPHPVVARSEHFTARDDTSAVRKSARILKHLSNRPGQYGDLWMRDPGGGTSADYVEMVEVPS